MYIYIYEGFGVTLSQLDDSPWLDKLIKCECLRDVCDHVATVLNDMLSVTSSELGSVLRKLRYVMYICILYICMYIYVYIYIYVCDRVASILNDMLSVTSSELGSVLRKLRYICIYICIYDLCVYIYVCICIYIYICIFVSIYIYIIYIYIHIYLYTCIQVYLQTIV
jgi:hypothetical protein